jgi:hypothetical protein
MPDVFEETVHGRNIMGRSSRPPRGAASGGPQIPGSDRPSPRGRGCPSGASEPAGPSGRTMKSPWKPQSG